MFLGKELTKFGQIQSYKFFLLLFDQVPFQSNVISIKCRLIKCRSIKCRSIKCRSINCRVTMHIIIKCLIFLKTVMSS